MSYSVIEEEETLMSIRDNQNKETSIKLLKEIIIFDRLYFTHIFRTKSSIEDFKELENLVKDKAFLAFIFFITHLLEIWYKSLPTLILLRS